MPSGLKRWSYSHSPARIVWRQCICSVRQPAGDISHKYASSSCYYFLLGPRLLPSQLQNATYWTRPTLLGERRHIFVNNLPREWPLRERPKMYSPTPCTTNYDLHTCIFVYSSVWHTAETGHTERTCGYWGVRADRHTNIRIGWSQNFAAIPGVKL